MLQRPELTREGSQLAPGHGISDLITVPRSTYPLGQATSSSSEFPGIQTGGLKHHDLLVAFPLGVKTYCQSEHLQPCG